MTNNITLAGDLGAPASRLVDRVSDAIGGIAKPWQITRTAMAESKAEIIRAEARIEITDLERRAVRRMICEEAKKQENIESITTKALPLLSESARPEEIEDDWLSNFFDKSRGVSNDEMQQLWARLLASEAETSGRVSKKTVEIVSNLEKSDAETFAKLAQFTIVPDNRFVVIYDISNKVFVDAGLHFEVLSHLMDVGLLAFEFISSFKLNQEQAQVAIDYGTTQIQLTLPGQPPSLDIGQVRLTSAGTELIRTLPRAVNTSYCDYLIETWKSKGYSPLVTYSLGLR